MDVAAPPEEWSRESRRLLRYLAAQNGRPWDYLFDAE
jgi:hypothetical protein